MRFVKWLVSSVLLVPLLAGQSTFRVAADSSSGTYAKMLGEIVADCSDDKLNIVQVQGVSGGAAGNLDALFNNKADAAFLHSDVYMANAQADAGYNRLKTLVALYPEPIHILALRSSITSKPGMMSFGAKQEFNTLSDAKGFKVGAAGVGVYTARILTGQGEGGFSVTPFESGKQVIDALNSGDVALALFVGAVPLPNIENLDKTRYKLLPIGNRVSGVYRPATVNYRGLTNGPVKTLAPVATLLTRKFNTPEKIDTQRRFRACFAKNLGKLQDEGSPNWLQVKAGDQGTLPWLDLP